MGDLSLALILAISVQGLLVQGCCAWPCPPECGTGADAAMRSFERSLGLELAPCPLQQLHVPCALCVCDVSPWPDVSLKWAEGEMRREVLGGLQLGGGLSMHSGMWAPRQGGATTAPHTLCYAAARSAHLRRRLLPQTCPAYSLPGRQLHQHSLSSWLWGLRPAGAHRAHAQRCRWPPVVCAAAVGGRL